MEAAGEAERSAARLHSDAHDQGPEFCRTFHFFSLFFFFINQQRRSTVKACNFGGFKLVLIMAIFLQDL